MAEKVLIYCEVEFVPMDEDDQVLVEMSHEGLDLIGGDVKDGETPKQAALRIIHDIGVKIDPDMIRLRGAVHDGDELIQVFLAFVKGQQKLNDYAQMKDIFWGSPEYLKQQKHAKKYLTIIIPLLQWNECWLMKPCEPDVENKCAVKVTF